MINNRQTGRRRGRGGGQRPSGNVSGPNRQDNRSRGNAAQLHEKYKGMARDAQMAGDRVQTEYYLQFADHYFRVLNENRARFEEQRRTRDDEDDGDEVLNEADVNEGEGEEEREEAPRRRQRADRTERGDREDRPERSEREGRNGAERRPRRNRDEDEGRDDGVTGISLDALPPAIAAGDDDGEAEAVKPRATPRRRTRPPVDDADDIAPAA